MNNFIFLRALKHAEHTVFCVEDGQKTYYDPQFNKRVPYSSGQQVKRSILQQIADNMGVQTAPITFNYNISRSGELENKEPWSPCDPTYVDQLLGGWMKAKTGKGKTKDNDTSDSKENNVVKRRSPLSISAMRPLHPLLAGVDNENITFDRSDRPDHHPVNVRMAGSDRLLTEDEIEEFLSDNGRTLSRRIWIPENKRATGLFVYDVAIDLRTLFFGKCLVLPETERKKIIPALADALVDWRITSNQARTFSLMETLAIAVSDNANTIAAAIRAKLIEDGEKPKAKPVVDADAGADLFVALPCASYMITECESSRAIEDAKQNLIQRMSAFDYEHQAF